MPAEFVSQSVAWSPVYFGGRRTSGSDSLAKCRRTAKTWSDTDASWKDRRKRQTKRGRFVPIKQLPVESGKRIAKSGSSKRRSFKLSPLCHMATKERKADEAKERRLLLQVRLLLLREKRTCGSEKTIAVRRGRTQERERQQRNGKEERRSERWKKSGRRKRSKREESGGHGGTKRCLFRRTTAARQAFS